MDSANNKLLVERLVELLHELQEKGLITEAEIMARLGTCHLAKARPGEWRSPLMSDGVGPHQTAVNELNTLAHRAMAVVARCRMLIDGNETIRSTKTH